MVTLNKLDKDTIQVLGTYDGISVKGLALRVKVRGQWVWQYALTLLRGPRMVKQQSHPKEGTLTNEKRLLARIERACAQFDE